jgi:uncharacterized membrane protein YkvA (DUF1232 family)
VTAEAEPRLTLSLNEREQRLYDRLRARVVRPEPGSGSGLRDLLLLLPDAAVLLFRLGRDARVPIAAKLIALGGFAYLASPIDLLPDFIGPLGLIDDLIVVGASLSSLVNRVHPDLVRHHWPGRGDALDAIQRITSWTEARLTRGVLGLLQRLRPGRR